MFYIKVTGMKTGYTQSEEGCLDGKGKFGYFPTEEKQRRAMVNKMMVYSRALFEEGKNEAAIAVYREAVRVACIRLGG